MDELRTEQMTDTATDQKREISTIAFPYLDLDAAIEVATAIYNRSGLGVCELDELAAEMNQTVSGSFRMKTAAARIFELIDKDGKSSVKLSPVGQQIVISETQRHAKAEAFLKVPLYNAIFEKYKGRLLPPMRALEREMTSLGVSPKQADKARQAFERSARQAGYFESGEDRLVKPRVANNQDSINAESSKVISDENNGQASISRDGPARFQNSSVYHPFVQGLLDELPASDKFVEWTLTEQAEWLSAAASIFKLLSKQKGKISITATEENKSSAD